jgi:hypothetical protein
MSVPLYQWLNPISNQPRASLQGFAFDCTQVSSNTELPRLWLYLSKFEHWVALPSLLASSSRLLQLKGSPMHCSTVPCILLSFSTCRYINHLPYHYPSESISISSVLLYFYA